MQPRKRFLDGHLDIGEMLVVAQVDVVTRPVAADEVRFENKRFGLVRGRYPVDGVELRQHDRDLGAGIMRVRKIGTHPAPEVDGLSDIDQLAIRIFHEIDARSLGEAGDLEDKLPVIRGRRIHMTKIVGDRGG